ncbi:MAG: T9SS type A sorting domain-containing protein [Bacteroidia bacterium]
MKNVTISLACLFAFSLTAISQVITSSWAPTAWRANLITYDESVNGLAPGADGSGQNWDFSGLSSDSTFVENLVPPSTAAGASSFPEATVANTFTQDDVVFSSFFKGDASSYSLLGSFASGSGIDLTFLYSNPIDIMRFPVGFGQSFSDDFASSINSGGFSYQRNGSVQVDVDGSGTLTTPAGTFNDVLRLKSVESYQLVGLPPIPGSSTSGVITSYNYVSAAHPGAVLLNYTITDDLINEPDTAVGYADPTYVNLSEVASNSFEVYPNPANEEVRINTSNKLTAVEIIDIQGRVIYTQALNNSTTNVSISTSSFEAGIYLLRGLSADGKTFVQRLSIAH